jgi:endonuclease G
MKNYKVIFYSLMLSVVFTACSKDDDSTDNTPKNVNSNVAMAAMSSQITGQRNPSQITSLEFPKIKGENSIIIVHKAILNSRTGESGVNYSLEWDCSKKSQRWSCYKMYASINEKNTSRYYSTTNQYPDDESIPSQYRFESDPFWRSGYDHGHICPSADRLASADANYQTFFMSNMQPQVNGFNAGVWGNMENQLRTWNRNDFRDTLYVCKGGTIDNSSQILTTTGKGLIVPKYFFMAILCKNSSGYKALGFWVEHQVNSDEDLGKYVVSIDDLEAKTGIDFFCNLPDDIENSVESLPVENIKRAWGLNN